jgi:hypothetical protein
MPWLAAVHATEDMGFEKWAWVIEQAGHGSSIDFAMIHLTLQALSPKLFSKMVIAQEPGSKEEGLPCRR